MTRSTWPQDLWRVVHRRSAAVRMPLETFEAAVAYAAAADAGEAGRGTAQEHPAIRTLVDWWNQEAPAPLRVAAYPVLWMAHVSDVESDCRYLGGMDDEVVRFQDWTGERHRDACARVSDAVLVHFMQGVNCCPYDSATGITRLLDVAGNVVAEVMIGEPSRDDSSLVPALYALKILRSFEREFIDQWDRLHTTAFRGDRQAGIVAIPSPPDASPAFEEVPVVALDERLYAFLASKGPTAQKIESDPRVQVCRLFRGQPLSWWEGTCAPVDGERLAAVGRAFRKSHGAMDAVLRGLGLHAGCFVEIRLGEDPYLYRPL